ncbi:adenylyltransferase/cytidyltransferase family protein [Methanosphaera cuniculi]|uniref:adenylyltransferase/cytidyltransferase family protein n=1 Tax=Methanosphaera cuniculi TaxID=1077256 RepID=UPI0026F32B6D|nr:adenylyltransferase/cytidyltransferase family protein [Methanosphaera cuniculi]
MASGTFDILHPGHVFYLDEARKLGGENAKLMVVIATDKTVHKHKRIPIVDENQRAEMVSSIKGVDEVFIGDEEDPFKIVKTQKPDIIAIGPDQNFNPQNLEEKLKNMGLNIKVVKIKSYKTFELDSTCKIIQKIKKTHFNKQVFDDCDL